MNFKNKFGPYDYEVFTPCGGNKHAGVVFAPGKMSFGAWYSWVGLLGFHGYTVLTFSVPMRRLLSKDPHVWSEGIMTAADLLRKQYYCRKVAGAGHSVGANGAILEGDALDAVIALAPGWPASSEHPYYDDIVASPGQCTAPTLVMVGLEDKVTGADKAVEIHDRLPGIKKLEIIHGGNHVQFMDVGIPAAVGGLFDGDAEIDHADQLSDTLDVMRGWLDMYMV